MNLLISELQEHQKVLDAFQELPADLRMYIQTFYISVNPVMICSGCNWAVVPPSWSIVVPPCHFCFCVHYVPNSKKRISYYL